MNNIPWRRYRTEFNRDLKRRIHPDDLRENLRFIGNCCKSLFDALEGLIRGKITKREFDNSVAEQVMVLAELGINSLTVYLVVEHWMVRLSLEYRYLGKEIPWAIAKLGEDI